MPASCELMWSSRADSWTVEGCECKRNAEAKTKSFSTTHNQRFPLFLKYWPFPASWIYFFIFNGTLKGGFSGFLSQDYQITVDKFYNGNWWWEARNKKEEYASFYYTLIEKSPWQPVRIDWQQFWTEKAQVRPGTQTLPAQTECHRSTTFTTTTSNVSSHLREKNHAVHNHLKFG